jgi:hypothetical protein
MLSILKWIEQSETIIHHSTFDIPLPSDNPHHRARHAGSQRAGDNGS